MTHTMTTHCVTSADRSAFPLRYALLGAVTLVAALGTSAKAGVVDAPDGYVVRSEGAVSVAGNSTLFGSLGSVGPSSLGWGATVTGNVETGSPHAWTTPDIGAIPAWGAEAVNIGWNESLSLDPGIYGALSSGSQATLLLDAGSYVFSTFQLGWSGNVIADTSGGDVYLHVGGALNAADQASFQNVGSGTLYIITGGSANFGFASQVNGAIYSLGSQSFGGQSQLNGLTWSAGPIDIGYGSTFVYAAPVPAPGAAALAAVAAAVSRLRRRRR